MAPIEMDILKGLIEIPHGGLYQAPLNGDTKLKFVYIGSRHPTPNALCDAFDRFGHEVFIADRIAADDILAEFGWPDVVWFDDVYLTKERTNGMIKTLNPKYFFNAGEEWTNHPRTELWDKVRGVMDEGLTKSICELIVLACERE